MFTLSKNNSSNEAQFFSSKKQFKVINFLEIKVYNAQIMQIY